MRQRWWRGKEGAAPVPVGLSELRLLQRGFGALGLVAMGLSAPALGACSGQARDSLDPTVGTVQNDVEAASVDGAPVDENALTTPGSCDALLGALQAGFLEELEALADQVRRSNGVIPVGVDATDSEEGARDGAGPSAAAVPKASSARRALLASAAGTALASDGASAGKPSSGFSTTTAVPGVDDGDYVKAEGDRIYMLDVLNTQSLYVLSAWPAEATEVVASLPIEGAPLELLVHDGVVAVFSRLLASTPRLTDPGYPGYELVFTKVTLVDTKTSTPTILRETYVEGGYLSSHRHDSVIRVAIRQAAKETLEWPTITTQDVFGRWFTKEQLEDQISAWARLQAETIESSTLADYLPGVLEPEPDGYWLGDRAPGCDTYLVPPAGVSPLGALSLVSFDLAAPAAPFVDVTVLGSSSGVHEDDDALIVEQTQRHEVLGEPISTQTRLHLFGLAGIAPRYLGSGSVPGYVSVLDEVGGAVRATMTQEVYGNGRYMGNVAHVVTFGLEGGRLVPLGSSPDLGADGSIYAARFLGDRAYLLMSPDPPNDLVVLDLSDPHAPRITARVPTLGITNALLPLPDNRLLAVTYQGDPRHEAVELLDVSDASAPIIVGQYVYPESTSSEADWDARALSFDAARNVVAFPLYQPYYTSLEVFDLSGGALTRLGSIVPESPDLTLLECLVQFGYPTDAESVAALEADPAQVAAVLQQCNTFRPRPTLRRSFFHDDTVFPVSYTSVAAHGLGALGEPPLGQVDLPTTLPDDESADSP